MTITRSEIKQKLDARAPMTLIEALPSSYFEAEHLPGAINIPHDAIEQKAEHMLPDKEALIVVYCASRECQNSQLATQKLREMGYSQVHEYVEGKQDWREANLPLESGK